MEKPKAGPIFSSRTSRESRDSQGTQMRRTPKRKKSPRLTALNVENIPPPSESCQSENNRHYTLLHRLHFVALDIVEAVLILAEIFAQGPLGMQRIGHVRGPRLRVGLGVVKREVDRQMIAIHAVKPLGHLQLVAVRMAHTVEPGLVAQIHRL